MIVPFYKAETEMGRWALKTVWRWGRRDRGTSVERRFGANRCDIRAFGRNLWTIGGNVLLHECYVKWPHPT